MPFKFGGKWEMECLNTRFLLPTVLYARHSVKLKKEISENYNDPDLLKLKNTISHFSPIN